jgi:predicted phosphoribosyltransferase/pimeloyl-ACP methyl ester carboxylesterase
MSSVTVGPHHLEGILRIPADARGLVIFAHGSGSGRLSPRNNYVASRLENAGFATLLLDLLTTAEEADRRNVFDIELLASRLAEATDWAHATPELATLPISYFGASTGGGAALVAASMAPERISAVVSRGGRPDLAGEALPLVEAPTLLLVGSNDEQVLELNRWAMRRMRCAVELRVVPGASHLFEEPGTLDIVVVEAVQWFRQHLGGGRAIPLELPFADRRAAGRLLAEELLRFKPQHPLVLALPRGGVPIAYEVAERLDADLDLLLVRKLGAPNHPEFGIGAVIDGENPQIVLNHEITQQLSVPSGYIHNEAHRQLREIERRREEYLGGRKPIPVAGRTVIVVDDGIATGSTVRAALRAIRRKNPAKVILAVPVGAPDSVLSLQSECDEVVCLVTPDPFHAVGAHYDDFTHTSDDEVKRLLESHPVETADAE